ncbi:MAG TPA: serine protease [Verrucomicrobiales bacterium]|jgi:hypothetical protein|nr:serine protease [Verrucomicrobiales bacterium]
MSSLPLEPLSSGPKRLAGRLRTGLLGIPLCLWLAFGFSGCRHLSDTVDQEKTMAGEVLNARRAASLRLWSHKTIGGEPVMGYTLARTALLLPSGMKMTLHETGRTGDVVRYDARFTGRSRTVFAGSAVAVAADGYFLTAAHCLDEGSPTLVTITRDGELRAVPSRIVWCGSEARGEPDLGLVHAPLTPGGTVSLTGLPARENGTLIFTGGFGSHGLPDVRAGGSGGRVVHIGRIQELPSGARWRELRHNAPLAPGDSGGPVIDERGRLLAINTEVRGTWNFLAQSPTLSFYRGVAVCPDSAWIQSLIDKDRLEMRRVRR